MPRSLRIQSTAKPKSNFAGDHGLVAVFHLPGLRSALGNGGDQFLDVEAGLHGEVQPFGKPLNRPGDANLVHHLGELPAAGRAHQIAGARIGGDHLLGLGERGLVAAAHHREHAVLGAGLAARNRRIDEIEAALFRFGVKLARDLGRSGGVVDHDGALGDPGEHAVVAEHDLAQIVVVADAGHDEILALGGLLRRRRGFAAAILRDPFFGLGGGAVVDRDLVAALVLEMPCHRVAHHAEPDKRHLRHCFLQEPYGDPRPSP